MRHACLREEDFDAIYTAFSLAFSDYQVRFDITKEQLEEMITRRGFKYELSVGAFDDNSRIVGIVLNGLDTWKGELTAYDTGTGVIPEFRGKGVADEMFDFLVPILQKAGVKKYLLEVIRSNEKACKLYRKKGLRETRQFECFVAEAASLKLQNAKKAEVDVTIRPVQQPSWDLYEKFWDWDPSWQNSVNSIRRSKENKRIIEAYIGSTCVGYAVFYPASGDIAQFAVDKSARRNGVGTSLIETISKESSRRRLAVVNVDSCSEETLSFLTNLGFKNFAGQFEMELEL